MHCYSIMQSTVHGIIINPCYDWIFGICHRYNKVGTDSEIKEELKYHFMSPWRKLTNKGRRTFPCKLVVQIINIILVTTQVYIVDCIIVFVLVLFTPT